MHPVQAVISRCTRNARVYATWFMANLNNQRPQREDFTVCHTVLVTHPLSNRTFLRDTLCTVLCWKTVGRSPHKLALK